MSDAALTPAVTSPAQSLCVRCGLCCDGTIFERARLIPADDLARLAAGGFILLREKAGDRFALPCHHHHDRVCTIYQGWRPTVCHTFRCQLLRRFDAGKIGLDEAHVTITQTTELADRVWAQLRERVGEVNGALKKLFRAWEATQPEQDAAWRRQHAAFLLDYAGLQWRLDRYFRLKPEVVEITEMKGNESA
jgi:hypothetical protein